MYPRILSDFAMQASCFGLFLWPQLHARLEEQLSPVMRLCSDEFTPGPAYPHWSGGWGGLLHSVLLCWSCGSPAFPMFSYPSSFMPQRPGIAHMCGRNLHLPACPFQTVSYGNPRHPYFWYIPAGLSQYHVAPLAATPLFLKPVWKREQKEDKIEDCHKGNYLQMSGDRKDYPDIVKLQLSLFININSTTNFSNLKLYLQIFKEMIYGSFENFDCILIIFIPSPFQIHLILCPHNFVSCFLKSPLVAPIPPYMCGHPLGHGWSCMSKLRKT